MEVSDPDPVLVSVVIPAFNEAAHIRKSLGALQAQTLPQTQFEVIVVDNGSADATVAEATGFIGRLPLQVVSKTRCSISAVRNYGASLAQGRVLAFLDADCIPPATWLQDALALGPAHSIWGAHYLVPPDSTWVGKVWFDLQARAQEGAVSFIPGSDLFILRADFEELGGFGESLETSEDVELSLRARKRGMQVIAFPVLAVYHEGTPRTLRHFYRQNRWHGTNVVRIFFANLPSTQNLPLVAMSFYTLLMFWAAVAIPLWALPSHHYRLAVTPVLLLLLPALLYAVWKAAAARRLQTAPPLFVLYATYFFARAASLTALSKRNHR